MHPSPIQNLCKHACRFSSAKTGIAFPLILSFILALTLAGCSGEAPRQNATPSVRYIVVSEKTITLTRELPGRVSAFNVSEVRPQVSGLIQARLFEEGADVEAGQILYQIDPALFQAAYGNAKANLERAEANLVSARLLAQRYQKIVKTDAISKQEYDNAVAAHGQAKAEVAAATEALEAARINLDYTKVTSPVSGRIGRSLITPGALVTQHQQSPLAVVQQLSPVYVDVTQSSTELLRLRRALAAGRLKSSGKDSAKVHLKLEDGSPYTRNTLTAAKDESIEWLDGELQFSDVTVAQSTGVVTIRATFENPDHVLLPGMYVRAVLEEGVAQSAILIPQKTLQRDTRGMPFVYVLSKEKPQDLPETDQTLKQDDFFVIRRSVTVERNIGENSWLITSGLASGDLLMVDGYQKARQGQIVSGIPLENVPSPGGPAQTSARAN